MYPIQTATMADKDELLALYRSLHNTPGCTWSDSYPNEEILTEDLASSHLFCMKDESGTIIAAVSIEDDPDVSCLPAWTIPADEVMELSRMAVRKDFQNQGIARRMLTHAMDYLKECGYSGAHFLVSQQNFKALASYQTLGFRCCGHAHVFDHDWYCYEKRFD